MAERKRVEEELRESEERFRTAFEDAPIGVALVDFDRRYLRVNRALCQMLGYSEEELLEKTTPEVTHPDDREISTAHVRRTLEGETETFTLERRFIHADGHTVWVLSSVSLIRDSQDNPSHFVCLYQDITERKELEERLQHQAFHDSLTELPNRALFLDRLGHALARTRREGGSVTVLFVDLNNFKVINDSLGHDAGNAVLVEVAERLKDSVRPGDTVGRLFGDEFVLLLEPPIEVNEAQRVAERIQERLQAPFNIEGTEVFMDSSIGIATGDSAQDQPEDILRHADLAMYAAKKKGKAEYEIYSPNMNIRVVERSNLESELRRAVEREEFEAHYQPMIDLRTGKIEGVEALARWRHPERGLVVAEEFIQTAEETGLIRPIGRQVFEKACWQAKEWREQYPDKAPLMSVNLSARQFSQRQDLTLEVLRETGLDPRSLQVEITEQVVIDDARSSIEKLQELKEIGVSLAIDDYGIGYSGLYYLKHMPIDFLKIDRSFIVGLGEDPGDEAIVAGTIVLAHALGVIVIAEGAETERQLAKLRELGCDLVQGYYFTKPLPSETAERMLVEDVS